MHNSQDCRTKYALSSIKIDESHESRTPTFYKLHGLRACKYMVPFTVHPHIPYNRCTTKVRLLSSECGSNLFALYHSSRGTRKINAYKSETSRYLPGSPSSPPSLACSTGKGRSQSPQGRDQTRQASERQRLSRCIRKRKSIARSAPWLPLTPPHRAQRRTKPVKESRCGHLNSYSWNESHGVFETSTATFIIPILTYATLLAFMVGDFSTEQSGIIAATCVFSTWIFYSKSVIATTWQRTTWGSQVNSQSSPHASPQVGEGPCQSRRTPQPLVDRCGRA